MKLTPITIERLQPGPKRIEIGDDIVQGLKLIVQPSGFRSFVVRYRSNGRGHKTTLGPFPRVSLKAARLRARSILENASLGYATDETIDAAVEQYLRRHGSKLRPSTLVYNRRELDRAVAAWRGRSLSSITRRDVIAEIDHALERGPQAANTFWKCLRAFLHWAEGRDMIQSSPARGLKRPTRDITRDRVLSDNEIAQVWKASGPFVRLLLLTACRRSEIGALQWTEITDGAINLSAERTKTAVAHKIPLTPLMQSIIDACPRRGRYVFGGDKPVSRDHSERKKIKLDIPHFTLHDLRRSAASGMARIGVAPHVIERVLNHSVKGMAGIYNRFRYEPEVAAALTRWSAHVAEISPKSG